MNGVLEHFHHLAREAPPGVSHVIPREVFNMKAWGQDWTCATNGHVFLGILGACDGGAPGARLSPVAWFEGRKNVVVEYGRPLKAFAPDPSWIGDCAPCGGLGRRECFHPDCGRTHECVACKGTGRTDQTSFLEIVAFAPLYVRRVFLARAVSLFDDDVSVDVLFDEPGRPLAFRTRTAFSAVMGMNLFANDEVDVHGKPVVFQRYQFAAYAGLDAREFTAEGER